MRKLLVLATLGLTVPAFAQVAVPLDPVADINTEWTGLVGANTALQNSLTHAKAATQALINEVSQLKADLKKAQDELAALKKPPEPQSPAAPPSPPEPPK